MWKMAKKKKADPNWWCTANAEECYQNYLVMLIFDENPSCIKSQLLACNTILKRFGNVYEARRVADIQCQAEALQHRIAGTYEKYIADRNAWALAEARRISEFFENDHQRVCFGCLHEYTTKGINTICPKCGILRGISINPHDPECCTYDLVVKFINTEKNKFRREVKNDEAVKSNQVVCPELD
jgi:hypothetical protein